MKTVMGTVTLSVGSDYEFSDDNTSWETGTLEAISMTTPLAYQSKDGNKYEWYAFIRQVVSQPVFTQAMAGNGELPQVGMEFIFCDSTNTKNNSIVTYVSEWSIVFKCLDDGFSKDVELAKEISGINIARQILPLDTRTDKEKAVDKIMNDHEKEALSVRHLLSFAYDKWAGE